MTGAEQNEMFLALLDRMGAVRKAKNKDYANEKDSLANFRMVEAMGMPAWIGILTRLGDKLARAQEQARKVLAGEELTFAVTDEGFDDLCVDGANYFLLMNVAFQEWRAGQEEINKIWEDVAEAPAVGLPDHAAFSNSWSEAEVLEAEDTIQHFGEGNVRYRTFPDGRFKGRPVPSTVQKVPR